MSISIPVLMYHSVNDELRDSRDVSVKTFESHIKYIAEHGYTSLTAMALYKALKGETPMPAKPVVITFDDGFRDNYTNAFPILKRYHVKAVYFVVSSRSGDDEPDFISWEEMREMEKTGIIDIESHTHRHRKDNLEIIGRGGEEEIFEDLTLARKMIGEKLGKECRFLAWPQGHYNAKMLKIAEEAGYYSTFITENGPNISLQDGKIRRFKVKERSVFWLRVRLFLYGNSFLASVYAKMKKIGF